MLPADEFQLPLESARASSLMKLTTCQHEEMTGHVEDITINGRRTPLWSKPGNFTNSELTLSANSSKKWKSTEGSTENVLCMSKGRRHARRPLTGSASVNFTDSGVELQDSDSDEFKDSMLKKSVTFNQSPQTLYNDGSGQTSSDPLLFTGKESDLYASDAGIESFKGGIKPSENKNWFTHSSHHLMDSAAVIPQNTPYSSQPPGALGAALAFEKLQNYENYHSQSAIHAIAQEYFPITLKTSSSFRAIETPMPTSLKMAPSARGLPQPNLTPWKPSPRRPKSDSSKRQSRSQRSSMSPKGAPLGKSVDRLYLMAAEAPVTASSGVLLSTPYQFELANLRMERLRLEEEHLLEVKRQEELERIRGPQPKWYEMKTPDFHYEAHKNNELLQNQDNWQSLIDYRAELTRASKNFKESYLH